MAGVVLYLSPHLDDVVLSCPAHLQRNVEEGCVVRIATVFTGSGPAAAALYRTRRAEDRKAASALGAAVTHMGFLDAPFRSSRYGNFSGIVFGRAREYAVTRDDVARAIERLVARFRPSRVVCPMAVGNHVDHRLVRDAALLAARPAELLFYEDRPYAFLREQVHHVLGSSLARRPPAFWTRYFAAAYVRHYRGRTSDAHIVRSWAGVPAFPAGYRLHPVSKVSMTLAELARAMAALSAYRSQMGDLFADEAEREFLYQTTPEIIYRLTLSDSLNK